MNRAIRTGIVGLGRAGWGMHCRELAGREAKFEITAVCDIAEERLGLASERYPGIRPYANLSAMLANPDIELIDIATRSTDHVSHALLALAAGRTVFLEKPIATSHAEAKRLAAAAAEADGALFFRHNRRLEPAFQHIREIIASGLLGDVYQIKLRRQSFQRRADWQTLKSCGGGQLCNWGPHLIDHGLRFLESPLSELWSDLKLVAAVGDAEDHLKIVMKGENGRVVDIEISGGAAISEPVYLVFGSKGALTSDDKSITMRYLDPDVDLPACVADPGTPPTDGGFGNREGLVWLEEVIPVAPSSACTTASIWDHLYSAIREGKPFPITTAEALEVMQVIDRVKHGTVFA